MGPAAQRVEGRAWFRMTLKPRWRGLPCCLRQIQNHSEARAPPSRGRAGGAAAVLNLPCSRQMDKQGLQWPQSILFNKFQESRAFWPSGRDKLGSCTYNSVNFPENRNGKCGGSQPEDSEVLAAGLQILGWSLLPSHERAVDPQK